jgi:hypothetical protein
MRSHTDQLCSLTSLRRFRDSENEIDPLVHNNAILTVAATRDTISDAVTCRLALSRLRTPAFTWPAIFRGVALATTLALPLMAGAQSSQKSERPKLPYNMMGLGRDEIDAYDSKAEPVANAASALTALNGSGWALIRKYFPRLGTDSEEQGKRVHPEDAMDTRFFASYANEDATRSPMALLSAIASLPVSQLSGKLLLIHDEVARAISQNENYSAWPLDKLRQAVDSLTSNAKTVQGVKCRTAKHNLTFQQSVQLYAMTIALLRMETKWAGKADSPPPDMADFSNRLSHQTPREVRDGETIGFFFYRPGSVAHGLSKEGYEERADVVLLSRSANVFQVQQFPVYLTVDEKEWSPTWIEPRDEMNDSTLPARKFEHDWTRLDGPYLWYRSDLLTGRVLYTATIRFPGDDIVIEADREIESRGAVKRAERPRNYDPLLITAFVPGREALAQADNPLSVEPPALEEQLRTWPRWSPYFSNRFRAWCAYGLWDSGLAADGRTWITVLPDEPRKVAAASQSQLSPASSAEGQLPAQP